MNSVGGMALKNGIIFRSNDYEVVSILTEDNEIEVTYEKIEKSDKKGKLNIPFIRGLVVLFGTMFQNFKFSWKSTLAMALLVYIISVTTYNASSGSVDVANTNGLTNLIMLMVMSIYMKATQLAKFHSAEHMGIATLENDLELTSENISIQSRIHEYCGTNLVTFVLLIGFILGMFEVNSIISLLISISVGYELFILNEGKIYKLLKPVYTVGFSLQKYLYTSKPDDIHIKVAKEGLMKLQELEGNSK